MGCTNHVGAGLGVSHVRFEAVMFSFVYGCLERTLQVAIGFSNWLWCGLAKLGNHIRVVEALRCRAPVSSSHVMDSGARALNYRPENRIVSGYPVSVYPVCPVSWSIGL